MPKVYIVQPNHQYRNMYLKRGWIITSALGEADLVQFTGGEDVSPMLYDEDCHPSTHFSSRRDEIEQRIFRAAHALALPMVGICRGGQFLNVMCGGKMWQHVNGHAISTTHPVINTATDGIVMCTSTHHQMMRPADHAKVLGVASEATTVENMVAGCVLRSTQSRGEDVEVVFYEDENVLCFQPHPEYMPQDSACQNWYFKLIEEHL